MLGNLCSKGADFQQAATEAEGIYAEDLQTAPFQSPDDLPMFSDQLAAHLERIELTNQALREHIAGCDECGPAVKHIRASAEFEPMAPS